MKFSAQEPGLFLSAALHAGLLAFGLIALSSPRPFDEFAEAVPVDVISDAQFRELTKGDPKEKQVQPDTPLRVDRIAKTEEQRDPGQEKKDVPAPPPPPLRAAVKEAPEDRDEDKPVPPPPPALPKVAMVPPPPVRSEPPKPEVVKAPPPKAPPPKEEDEEEEQAEIIRQRQLKLKQEQQKAEEARRQEEKLKADRAAEAARKAAEARALAQAQAEAKARAEAQAQAQAEAKALAEARQAEALRKAEEARKAAEAKRIADENHRKAQEAARKASEAKKAEEARKAQEKAESDKLQAAIRNRLLASRETPSSSGATGQQVTRTASAGVPTASGRRLSPSDREHLMGLIKEQMERCWSVTGMSNPAVKPLVRLQLTPTGHIAVQPALVNSSGDPAFRAIADSGMRAIRACAPYRIPGKFADTFEDWKNITVKLDPSDLL